MRTWTIILLCLLVVTLLRCYGREEGFSPEAAKIANGALKKIRPKIAGKDAIAAVGLTLPVFKTSSSGVVDSWFRGKPKTATLRAATKYTLTNGVELVGPGFVSVKASGKNVADAEARATLMAQQVLEDLLVKLKNGGLAVATARIAT